MSESKSETNPLLKQSVVLTQSSLIRSSIKTVQEEKEANRVQNLLSKAGDSNVGAILEKIQPILDIITNLFNTALPYIIKAYQTGASFYNSLPLDIIYAFLGILLVFFGGTYCLIIAAIETFYLTGYPQVKEGVSYLIEEFEIIYQASRKDDKLDDNNDGIEDVKQISIKELAQRKIALFFTSCNNPQKVFSMISQIITSLISVIAVLKVQFAKVIALGTMIGECMRRPAEFLLVPTLGAIVPQKYQKWISPVIGLVCRFLAITIAWFIQRIISSVQSAIRGGLMFSRRILKFAKDQGYFPSYNEDAYYDEALGWSVAALGVLFQLFFGFGLPFPLNFVFFPVTIFENYLAWVVSE